MDDESTSSAAASRLDMKHGFVKQIIRNQVSRDEYDKEVKTSQQLKKNKKRTEISRGTREYYLPPQMRKGAEENTEVSKQENILETAEQSELESKEDRENVETKEQEDVEAKEQEDVEAKEQDDVEAKEEEPQKESEEFLVVLFKLEYTDHHGQIHNRVVYKGENAKDIANELAMKTELGEIPCKKLEVIISKNIQKHLDRILSRKLLQQT
ncbi:UPF0561 protein C2orf68 homolog isoform X1 [Anneissia japonica]|uniref:UPF0561 protein C2orf68 homolog isoform X1 n=1 Tax=Anneissia japonica TaxID=1529436 RepID=UPI001425B14A|nr:UPF0561 protein C2orf68 homolog isoform X1 [Anneissia japonica]